MITIQKASQRGRTQTDWLDSRHTFSFGAYRDPQRRGYASLRVINEDRVAPGAGFPTHPHRDMEILSLVLEGSMKHRDSMGNGSIIRSGEIQKMTAGTGVTHSEFNASSEDPLHFYQIWIEPDRPGHSPSYAQVSISTNGSPTGLRQIAGPQPSDGIVPVHQDALLFLGDFGGDNEEIYELRPGRRLWVQALRGSISIRTPNDASTELEEGDGAAIEDVTEVKLSGLGEAQLLLFDLA